MTEPIGTDLPDAPEERVGWVTPTQAEQLWADADMMETAALREVLEAAHAACVAWLTPSHGEYVEPAEVPASWRTAQVLWARHIWARSRTGNSDQLGPDGMAVSTYPLVMEARSLLRPKRSPWAGLL